MERLPGDDEEEVDNLKKVQEKSAVAANYLKPCFEQLQRETAAKENEARNANGAGAEGRG